MERRKELMKQLKNRELECMICLLPIRKRISSCPKCYKIFHYECLKKWEKSCPNCSSIIEIKDSCFCGKGTDLNCGQTCLQELECGHKCFLKCHPGPHECTKLIRKYCKCKKYSIKKKCHEQTEILNCDKPCGKKMACGHECQAICCAKCQCVMDKTCFCGRETKTVDCTMEWSCNRVCDFVFDCGHQCSKKCHSDPHLLCDFASNGDYCPCGKEPINKRLDCHDPIKCCTNQCLKQLACGHECQATCHAGDCPPCIVQIMTKCRCGKKEIETKCSQEIVKCESKCRQSKICGRHYCSNICCDLTVHTCDRVCGKLLKCGNHTCLNDCGHPGKCHTCVEGVSFDEITCFCGTEISFPPIACGQKPPKCIKQCTRSLGCGHPNSSKHHCHSSGDCPPCTYYIYRRCNCEKELVKVMCYTSHIPNCGIICNKPIACGHQCKTACHSGPCPLVSHKCLYTRNCGHICQYPCHSLNKCDQIQPCRQTVLWQCECGNINQKNICSSTGNTVEYKLPCNDECFIKQRSQRMVLAMSNTMQDNWSISDIRRASSFQNIEQVESVLYDLIKNPRAYDFPVANRTRNELILTMCESYGIIASIVDSQWKKGNVSVHAVSPNAKVPDILLSSVVKVYKQGMISDFKEKGKEKRIPNSIYLYLARDVSSDISELIESAVRENLKDNEECILFWMDDYECFLYFGGVDESRLITLEAGVETEESEGFVMVGSSSKLSNETIPKNLINEVEAVSSVNESLVEKIDGLSVAEKEEINTETISLDRGLLDVLSEKLIDYSESINKVWISPIGVIHFESTTSNVKKRNTHTFRRLDNEWKQVLNWKKLGIVISPKTNQ